MPSEHSGVIYEVNLEADAAIEASFDTWLRDHIADLLQFPGFQAAEILGDTNPPPGRIRRTVQYRLRDQATLDDYLRTHAPRMRTQGIERFGSRFTADRRVLRHREDFTSGAVSTENCLNCGEVLTGQHCAHCGQRAKVRVISLWGLVRDVLGDLLDWDSRVWRTLRPLAFRPGLLTQEFLRGRRARYTPPFRMYLILSVLFFLFASIFDPGKDIAFQVGDEGTGLVINDGAPDAAAPQTAPPDASSPKTAPADTTVPRPAGPAENAAATRADEGTDGRPAAGKTPQLDAKAKRAIDEIVKRLPPAERESTRAELERELAQVPAEYIAQVEQVIADPCSEENIRIDGPPFLQRYAPRLRQACTKIVADQQSFGRALFENLPKMMFLFLPLIAVVMAVLYLGSGRYYVEHLLFFVHYHAFFFLAGIAVLFLDWLGTVLPPGGAGLAATVEGLFGTVLVIYVPLYLYLAMRRVYGQGRFWTITKFGTLVVAYMVCLTLTGIGLLVYTALTL